MIDRLLNVGGNVDSRQLITLRPGDQIGKQLQGVSVDAVDDIVSVGPDNIQPVPELGDNSARQSIEEVAAIGGGMIMIVALDMLAQQAAPEPIPAPCAELRRRHQPKVRR